MVKGKGLRHAGPLLPLLFHSEDGGDIFLGNSDIKSCSMVKGKSLLHAGPLLGFVFYPEDGGDIFIRNFGILLTRLHSVISQTVVLIVTAV
jgi:hypothetical protein